MILINRASAGSGKTFTLVKEYLIMLLGKKTEAGNYVLDENPADNHKYILAITFTNKATDEMKNRIVETLDILATNPDESPYLKDLSEKFGATKEKISLSAQTAERQILEDYTNFNVCTIDTFFQKILRTFAFEVNLSGNYAVELNDDYVVALGVSSLKTALRGKSGNSKLGTWLWQYVRESIDKGKSWDVFSEPKGKNGKSNDSSLYNFAKALTKEIVKQNSQELFDFLKDPDNMTRFNKALQDSIVKHSLKIKDEARAALEMLNREGVKPYSYFYNYLDGLVKSDIPLKNRGSEAGTRPAKYINKTSAPIDESAMSEHMQLIEQYYMQLEACNNILQYSYQLGLLGDINASVHEYTADNNTILLSGTNDIVKRIISECDTPFIYERIGMYLHNYLIDEFQDTSRMQWENLLPLVREGMSNGYDSLIIGDVKQSIYRFRNSDPQLLHSQVADDFQGQIRYNEGRSINWRSARNIVLWNNAFFKFLSSALGMEEYYADVEQDVCPKNESLDGHVIVTKRPKEAETDDDGNKIEYETWAMDKMVEDLQDLLSRGFRQKDIAILSSKNDEGQCAIERIMRWNIDNPDRQMKVVSEESLLVNSSPTVRVIVDILRMLDRCENPDERGDELPMVMRRFEMNRYNGMDGSEAFEKAITEDADIVDSQIDRLHSLSKSASLDSVVLEIMKSMLSEKMVAESTPYLNAFLDSVADFMERYGSNIHHFLKWWDKVGPGISISSPDNIDAIRVITIHKSKGLQFPCVLIPFFDWNFDTKGTEWIETKGLELKLPPEVRIPPIIAVNRSSIKQESIFDNKFKEIVSGNIMDSLNKTYVACTRAQYELILYTAANKKLGDYLCAFLKPQEDGELKSCLPSDYTGDAIYELGEPLTRAGIPELNKKAPTNNRVANCLMPDLKIISDCDRWKLTSPDIILEVRGSQRWEGELLHRVMEKVRTPADLDKSLRTILAKGLITDQEKQRYSELLEKRIADPRVAEWFAKDNRLLLEREITTAGDKHKRPDRVVMKPNGEIIIIDYKFGDRSDANDVRYARQVAGYKQAVCNALHRQPDSVSGYIWYLHPGDIVAV